MDDEKLKELSGFYKPNLSHQTIDMCYCYGENDFYPLNTYYNNLTFLLYFVFLIQQVAEILDIYLDCVGVYSVDLCEPLYTKGI